ncbi:Hypothetical predicted protein [Mytilus galloprovincialis]|uniref:Reverse transcriptase domain-containing protein n=1 Tax=Mytilus galloprovincialis TaxID=29158 RepID=A0A8B6BVZ9_MYTGA|nr:Hypothetical predicted protein [Mytilus galloprovincialis]
MTTNNPTDFWNKIKQLGPRRHSSIPMEIYDKDGEIVSDEKVVLEKWKTDFENIYNMDSSADDFDGNFQKYASSHKVLLEERMLDPLFIENEELNSAITIDEIRRLVSRTKNGKSCGIDNIPYEVLKTENVIAVLYSMFQLVFDTSIVPSLWHQAIICPILKDKSSDKRIPLHYRGISLLSCVSKLYSGFINNRVSSYLEDNDLLSEEQNGFRKNRSCEDHIFTLTA